MINEQRLRHYFEELVTINSPTFNEFDIEQYLTSFARKHGLFCKVDGAGSKIGGNCGNIYLRMDGDASLKPLFFSAHIDTVADTGNIKLLFDGKKYYTGGNTILGADDKAGVAAILELFSVLEESKRKYPTIEAVFTVAEEVGLLGAKNFDTTILQAKEGFVLDDHGNVGRAIIAAPVHYTAKCTVYGKSAHAGLEPEKGNNAIQALARAVLGLPSERIGSCTTANVGKISGGEATNIVPGRASVEFEMRSLKPRKAEELIAKAKSVFSDMRDKTGCNFELEIEKEYDAYSFSSNFGLLSVFGAACEKNGVKMQQVESTGGSDANIFNQQGISALNVSVGMRDVHSKKEHIYLSDLKNIASIIVSVVFSRILAE